MERLSYEATNNCSGFGSASDDCGGRQGEVVQQLQRLESPVALEQRD